MSRCPQDAAYRVWEAFRELFLVKESGGGAGIYRFGGRNCHLKVIQAGVKGGFVISALAQF